MLLSVFAMGHGVREEKTEDTDLSDVISLCHLAPAGGWSQAQGQWAPTQGELPSGMGGPCNPRPSGKVPGQRALSSSQAHVLPPSDNAVWLPGQAR